MTENLMRRLRRLIARARDGRPGVPFALAIGIGCGLLIANLVGGSSTRTLATSEVPGGSATSGPGGVGPAAGGVHGPGAAGPISGPHTGPGTGATANGPGATGSSASGAAGGGTARGVTARTITIGVAYLDLSGVQYLGPDYNVGDPCKQWHALVDGWHRAHQLPVSGRDIRLACHSFNVLQPTQQRAVCAQMIQDDKVFAVVSPEFFYQYGAECVTAENHTPLITSDGPTDDVYQSGAPFLYTIMPSSNQQLANMVYWANQRGLLAGKKIGVYHLDDPNVQRLVNQSLKGTLAHFGYHVTAEATTSDANGGPEDAVAVQTFRNKGVNLAIIMTSNMGFMQQAQAQRYKPTYIGSDYNGYTTYLQGENYPKSEFSGSEAVTTTDRGMDGAGIPPSSAGQACISNYNRYSGEHVQAASGAGQHNTAEVVYILMSCDEGALLMHALQSAGANLTNLSFAAGMQTVRNMAMDYFPHVTFGPGKYTGVTEESTVQWEGSCTCWVRRGGVQPLSMNAQ